MFEPFLLTGGAVIGSICIVEYTYYINSLYNKQHQEMKERKKTIEQLRKKGLEALEQMRKKSKKINFITQFIDEIPELSYYEAKQLEKKLGNIYLEWNDE
jgi:ABC-type uncharacterized transport system substrate-binding protein